MEKSRRKSRKKTEIIVEKKIEKKVRKKSQENSRGKSREKSRGKSRRTYNTELNYFTFQSQGNTCQTQSPFFCHTQQSFKSFDDEMSTTLHYFYINLKWNV